MTRNLLLSLGAIAAMIVPVRGQSVHYEGALSMASGTYIFTERTTSWTMSNGLAVSAGPFTFRTTLPLFLQNSTLLTGTTTGLLPTGGSNSGAVRDSSAARGGQKKGQGTARQVVGAASINVSGDPVATPASAVTDYQATIGDPTVGLSFSGGGRTSVTISAGAKIPTTDTTNFGTGEWDVGGGLGVSRFVGNSTLFSLDVSYWHLGDLPDLDLTDPIMASVGVAYLAFSGWGGSLSASGARSIIEGFDNSFSINAALTRVTSRIAVGVTGSVGFTETAPDYTIGVNWRYALTR